MLRTIALILALVTPARAEHVTDRHSYTITLAGIRAATLTLSGTEEAGRYRVEGNLESNGLVAIVRRVRYLASASGSITARGYAPARYTEIFDTPRRQSEAMLSYDKGIPCIASAKPACPPDTAALDPAAQTGTVDPLTALYAALRDTPRDQACRLTLQIFDRRRRSMVNLANPTPQGDTLQCTGEYRRIAGFTGKEMREKTRFPFTATLIPIAGDRLRVVEVRVETIFGRATLRRN